MSNDNAHNPHDTFVQAILEHESIALDLLQHEMPAHITEALDFSTLQRIETTYVSDDLRKTYSDRVFQANFKDSDKQAYIYMLFEHKSHPDNWCSLQL
ncbi:Rpn family recombination-promoting nuclease/putative transposase, partial [Desulfurispira natronophila]